MKLSYIARVTTSAAFALGIAICPAYSQQSEDIHSLNQRMNSLENKMNALIDLLEKQQLGRSNEVSGSQNQAAISEASSTNVPDGYVPGIYLDVFAPAVIPLQSEKDDRAVPSGTPAASLSLSPTSTVSYAEIMNHPETKRFAVENRQIIPSIVLSGYLKIKENGKHTLGIEVTNNSFRTVCDAKLVLNGRLLASKYTTTHDENFGSKSADVNLTAGFYAFKIFFECEGGLPVGYDKKSISFVMATPGERAPKAVSPSLLFIKQ